MEPDILHGFRFGQWIVEPLKGAITGSDEVPHHLQPKVMDVLVCLAENADQPVTREQLLDEVWGENAVSDEPLTRAIGELRRALHDDRGHPEYIETIPKRGYRLIGKVRLPEPVSHGQNVDPVGQKAHVTGRWLRLILMSFMFIAVTLLVYDKWWTPDPPEKSIAVLPFENMSGSMEYEYLSDGITEEILNALTKTQDLKVASKTSAFYFEGKEVPIAEIAETLGVAYILEGSVRQSGDRLRITAQLVDASNGYSLWSNTWERAFTDVFAIQDEIAAAVVNSLHVTLLAEPPKARRTDPEAYALYLRSSTLAWRFTRESMEEASRLLTQALAIDPEYAQAWGLLAVNQVHQTYSKQIIPDQQEGFARAEASARRALRLDPNNLSALLAMGGVAMYARWDFAEAGDWFGRARESAPGDASPLNAQGILYGNLGKRETAYALYQEAADRDPLHIVYLGKLAMTSYLTGRFDIARSQIEAMKKIDPEAITIPLHSGWLEWHMGNFEEALLYADQLGRFPQLSACTLYRLGRFQEAQARMDELQSYDPQGISIAEIYACWGNADKAFEWLERSYEAHDPGLINLRGDFLLDGLHDDPRWELLLQRVGVSDQYIEERGF